MPESAPRLGEAIAAELSSGLKDSADRWVRAELAADWPVAEALKSVFAELGTLRVGILQPFTASQFRSSTHQVSETSQVRSSRLQVSDDASQLTKWRNASLAERAASPTVILGEARGPEESGLRAVARLVVEKDVIGRWRS